MDHRSYRRNKELLTPNPTFATQLVLMKGDEVIVGVSNAPAMKELMYAARGQGCWLNDGRPVTVSSVSKLDEAYLSYGGVGYFDSIGKLEGFLSTTPQIRDHS